VTGLVALGGVIFGCGLQGKANFSHLLAPEWAAVEAFAKQARFPEQHLVLRPDGEQDLRICKGISTWEDLHAAFSGALADSANGLVFVETDGRAHANPTAWKPLVARARIWPESCVVPVRPAQRLDSGSSSASAGCRVMSAVRRPARRFAKFMADSSAPTVSITRATTRRMPTRAAATSAIHDPTKQAIIEQPVACSMIGSVRISACEGLPYWVVRVD